MQDPDGGSSILLSVPVGVIVVERESRPTPSPYNEQIEGVLAEHADAWAHVATFPRRRSRTGPRLDVYKLVNHDATPRFPITIEGRGTLRGTIVSEAPRR